MAKNLTDALSLADEEDYSEEIKARIRDLIDGYTSKSLLKEYLQNADDAGATELIVTYDKSIHADLLKTPFEAASGPALLISNNSKFKDKDFKSINKISAQGKANDPEKTGRFGQGFSSSFSVSDHPSIVSSGRAIWIDVLRAAVSKNRRKFIQKWEEEHFDVLSGWIDTFKLGLESNESLENHTVFRLPLRNDTSALESEISPEVFTFDKFLLWIKEWKLNAQNLLFLRNIERLVLQEIDIDGNKKVLLEIATKNSQELRKIRQSIQGEFQRTLLDTCQNWLTNDNVLPVHTYFHRFVIRENDGKIVNEENWAVTNGLFRGPNNCLIHQSEKVLSISNNLRKVLPWAGAAIRLNENDIPITIQQSQWYLFLPLPEENKYPLHLHGWFDSDSKRERRTTEGDSDDKVTLIEWNRLLLEYGVGVAWAYLIDFLKESFEPKNYYNFWPKRDHLELDKHLVKGFYTTVSTLEVLPVLFEGKQVWHLPNTECHLLKSNNEVLFEALQQHFKVLTPALSNSIVDNFKTVDVAFQVVNPELIREFLNQASTELMLPMKQKMIPIKMLSEKKWLIELLFFCSEDGEAYIKLEGLPLELTLDQNIDLIGNKEILLTNSVDEDLFQDNLPIMLDYDVYNNIDIKKELPNTWLVDSLKNRIALLLSHRDKIKMSKQWVKYLIEHIAHSSSIDIENARALIWNLPIVLQEDGQWKKLKSDIDDFSPVWIPKVELANADILRSLDINLVYPDYLDLYQPIVNLDSFITELTSETLVQQLLIINDYSIFKDDHSREYLIELLSSDTSWINKMSTEDLDNFKSIPFVKTANDELVSISQTKLFVAAKFSPPEHIKGLKGIYQVVHPKTNEQHGLYRSLGIQEQTVVNYIFTIIIPFIQNTSNLDEREQIILWLIKEWQSIRAEFGYIIKNLGEPKSHEDNERAKLKRQLQNTAFIPTKNGEIKKASELYLPSLQLPPCLYDLKYSPVELSDAQEEWSSFLKDLKASGKVSSEHIVEKVESIIERDNEDAYEEAICLLKYIVVQIEAFEKMTINTQSLLGLLQSKPWYPVEDPQRFLVQPEIEFRRFSTAKELARYNDAKLICGSRFVLSREIKFDKKNTGLELKPREIVEKLGLMTKLSIDDIIDSFNKLRELRPEDEKETKELHKYAVTFYRYIGRQNEVETFKSYLDDTEETIFINGDWKPLNRVFQQSFALNGLFYWNHLIESIKDGQDELKNGLIRLGIQESPQIEVLVELLFEIYQSGDFNEEELHQSRAILGELQEKSKDELSEYKWDIPILSHKDTLLESGEVYINDLPAYDKSEEKNDELLFCHRDFEFLAEQLDIAKLKDSIKPSLNFDNTVISDDIDSQEIYNRLHNDDFYLGLLRLLYDEDKLDRDSLESYSFEDLLPTEIIFTEKLIVDYYADDDFAYTDTNATVHIEEGVFYLLNEEDFIDMVENIAEHICNETDLTSRSFIVSKMIRIDISSEIKDFLDGKNIRSLPFQSNSEIESIRGESPYENVDIVAVLDNDASSDDVDDNSDDLGDTPEETDKEISEEVEDRSDEDIASVSDDSIEPVKEEEEKKKKDLPPPIDPIEPSSGKQDNNTYSDTKPSDRVKKDVGSDGGQKESISGQVNQSGSSSQRRDTNSQNSYSDKADSWKPSQHNTGYKTSRKPERSSDNFRGGNDYKPARVYKDTSKKSENKEPKSTFAKELGEKGEKFVASRKELLLSKDNYFMRTVSNNAGFDIFEMNSNEEIVRYIEVKTLSGKWGRAGVDITPTQYDYAKTHGDMWWLFVVEDINGDNPYIHQFKNPVLEITRYQFDHSWEQFALNYAEERQESYERSEPEVGDLYDVNGEKLEVVEVNPRGAFYLLKVKIGDKEKIYTKKFDHSWRKIYE